MIKGAIFDADGTLLDSMGVWENVGTRYLEGFGLHPQKDLRDVLFPMSMEEGAAYMIREYDLGKSIPEVIDGVKDTVRDFYFHDVQLKEGAELLLEEMKQRQIPMVLATSSEREPVEAALAHLGITGYFEEIFTCREVGAGKKNPRIYEQAAGRLGTAPDVTFVFEDVLHAIQTAKGAGFRTVGIYDASSERDWEKITNQADFFLKNITEQSKFWDYVSKGEEERK